jgi:hypothetical protein
MGERGLREFSFRLKKRQFLILAKLVCGDYSYSSFHLLWLGMGVLGFSGSNYLEIETINQLEGWRMIKFTHSASWTPSSNKWT